MPLLPSPPDPDTAMARDAAGVDLTAEPETLRIPRDLLHTLLAGLSDDARKRVETHVADWVATRIRGGRPTETLAEVPAGTFWALLEDTLHGTGWGEVRHERVHPGLVRLTVEATSPATRTLVPGVLTTLFRSAGGEGLAVAPLPTAEGASEARVVFGAPAAVHALEAALARGLDEGAALASL